MNPSQPRLNHKWQITPYLSLFLFLFSIYLLTYTPRINSSDGLAMFSTAESLVRRGALDIEQIRWMGLQQGTYGLDGLLYSRKGIGVPIGLLPLAWLGLVTPVYARVGRKLIEGVRNPTLVRDPAALDAFAIRPRGLRDRSARPIASRARPPRARNRRASGRAGP